MKSKISVYDSYIIGNGATLRYYYMSQNPNFIGRWVVKDGHKVTNIVTIDEALIIMKSTTSVSFKVSFWDDTIKDFMKWGLSNNSAIRKGRKISELSLRQLPSIWETIKGILKWN